MLSSRQTGVSIIEVMVVVATLGILVTISGQSFVRWTQNSQIRNAAEAIQNGLMLARSEAVRRNTRVRFQLTSSAGGDCALSATGTSWVVSLDNTEGGCDSPSSDTDAPRIIQLHPAGEGSANAVVDAGAVSTIIFNGVGRTDQASDVGISVTNPTGGTCSELKCLRVTVTTGGQIRMCDPGRSAGDPQGC